MLIKPTRRQFARLAEGASHVPVWGEILADRDTPVSAFRKLHRDGDGFLLESAGGGGERWGRYSFLGTRPAAILEARGNSWSVRWMDGRLEQLEGVAPLDELRRFLEGWVVPRVPGLPRFTGGLVGWLSYDAVRWVEHLPAPPPDDLGLPELSLMLVLDLVVFDSCDQKILLLTNADVGKQKSLDSAYDEAVARVEAMAASLDAAPPEQTVRAPAPVPTDGLSNVDRESYQASVERIREYIAAGDVIQVVLAQRFERKTAAHPFDVYRCLRSIDPSPYLTYLQRGDVAVVAASPEVLVRLEDGLMTVRPIAGTRPRAASAEEDTALERDLLADPKELAEHVMLLDLGRNDIGRVAVPGTVRVTESFSVERYAHVMHIVSNVEGRVLPGIDAIDALRAAFPAGTLSGAPKIRAMEIIDELETSRRGLYGGAIGYFGFDGSMDMAITIRTAVMKDGRAFVQSGAGIVADSVPASEHEECVRKARGVLTAVHMAESLR